jgi:pectate lyase
MGACVKVEKNSFENSNDPILSKNSDQPGNWMAIDNLFSSCTGSQPSNTSCTLSIPYNYTAEDQHQVKATVTAWAGIGKL